MQPPNSWLEIRQDGAVTVAKFTCQAFIGHEMAQSVSEQIFALVEKTDHPRLLLNFSGVEFCTSLMLAKLIRLHKVIETANGRLAVCSIAPELFEIFKLSHFDKMLRIYPDESAALEALRT